jgi:hypothetical protein
LYLITRNIATLVAGWNGKDISNNACWQWRYRYQKS